MLAPLLRTGMNWWERLGVHGRLEFVAGLAQIAAGFQKRNGNDGHDIPVLVSGSQTCSSARAASSIVNGFRPPIHPHPGMDTLVWPWDSRRSIYNILSPCTLHTG